MGWFHPITFLVISCIIINLSINVSSQRYGDCRHDEYQCQSGKCIPRNLMCNRHNDCENGDDEQNCDGDRYCGHDEFPCDDGCKPNYLRCDGNRDCMDGIDEHNCNITRPTQPTPGPYPCPELTCPGTAKCYLYSERCDGIPDCDDRSDEHSCCRPDQITCSDGSCASKCNGVPECRDSSDEWNCPTYGCQPYQWRCDDGQCINQYDKCNGRADCRDYSDERNCPTPQPPTTTPTSSGEKACGPHMFRCENGPCIPIDLKCNGQVDCPLDISDELDCDDRNKNEVITHPPTDAPRLHLKTYPSSQIIKESREVVFRCRDEGPIRAAVRWTRPGGRPLPIGAVDKQGRLEIPNIRVEDAGDYVCEAIGYPSYTTGQNVLVNLVVEKYRPPTLPTACQYHEATCMNGECIDKKQICDGIHNCADGSDEHSCSHGRKCSPNQFLCKNSKCVDRIWRCDGENDCGDNSDEESCDPNPSNAPCRHDEYQCHSGHCVPKSFHCDGTNDCQDGSDEIGCTAPAVITPPPPRVNLEIGQTLNISCRATGVPIPVIVFRLNWGHVPDKCVITSYGGYGTLYCPNMQIEDSGAYSCEIINIKGVIFVTPDTIVTVYGKRDCDAGYFNKLAIRREECIQCFCFGVSNQCNSADLYTYALPAPITSHKVVGIEIPQYGDIIVNDYADHDLITLRHGVQFRVSNIPYSRQQPYLELPQEYKGSQLKSYGGYLKYNVQYIGNGRPTNIPDVIIIGNGYTLTHHSRTPIEPNIQNELSVRFVPGNWKKSNNRDATREEIMMVLAGVDSILIRLEYIDATEREVELTHITMDSAGVYDLGLGSASLVEQCTCPTGYTGFSCESCAPGYTRQPGGPWLGRCVLIEHRECESGEYGDESRGIRCRQCPCPLTNPGNNFARGCQLSSDGDVQCACIQGYMGRRCEQCAPGYDGDPMTIGCHIRPITSCDPYGTAYTRPDGSCECKAHVVGPLCNMCAPNSFHLNHFTYTGCIDCFCMGVTKTCSSSTWYRDRVQSDFSRRNRLQHGFQLVANYEVPTPADVHIEEYNNQLVLRNPADSTEVLYWSLPTQFLGDKVTAYGGNLSYILRYNPMPGGLMSRNVAPDVVLKSANDIVILHYRKNDMLPTINQNYSIPIIENAWQRSDGITINREHLLMALADVEAILIKATYTTVTSEASLSLVSLDTAAVRSNIGSTRRAVEVEQCSCPPGYLGLSCQDCAPGYKRSIDQGLYLGLCEQCECNDHSNECDPETGVCLNCRDNTEGEQCERCAPGYYGNATTGDCEGTHSHDCQNCDERGTVSCRNNQCICKNNVIGPYCDQCRHGSFNLNITNSFGCSECFCSGLTQSCSRANLYKQLIPLPFIDNTPVITDIDGNVLDLNVDIDLSENRAIYRTESRTQKYWSLSSNQLGNRIKSYGGYLEFEQNVESYQQYVPAEDIILFGNGVKISWTRPSHLENQPQVHIRLHEDEEWYRQDRENRHRASRIDIMQVLSNLDHILIRATTKIPTISTSLSNIVLETAEYGGPYGLTIGDVEICQCPVGYDGTSCESCAPLYYRNVTQTHNGFFGTCIPCPCGEETESCEMQAHMNGNVVCHCKIGYSGDRCQYPDNGGPPITTERPIQEATISVRIVTPSINIVNIGGSITLKCNAIILATREPIPISWYKLNDQLPRDSIITPNELYLQHLDVHDSGIYVCVAEHDRERVEEIYRLNVGNEHIEPSRPNVTINPSHYDIEEYNPVEIYCQASGYPKPEIIWTKVDGPLSSNIQIIDDRLYVESVHKSDEGTYSCTARNYAGTDDGIVRIYVHPRRIPPTRPSHPPRDLIYIEPSSFEGRPGDTVRLNCQLRASITVDYEWLRDNNRLYENRNLDINNNILTIRDANIRDSGVYECRVVDIDTGNSYTATSSVAIREPDNIREQRPSVTPLSQRHQVIQGSDLTISCIAFGRPTPRIHWTKVHESMDSNIQTYDNVLRIINAQPSNRGEYICVAENPAGSDQSTTYIDVEPRERPAIEIYPHEPQNVRVGQTVQLNCRTIAGIPEPSITWRRSDGRPFSSRITIHQRDGTIIINDVQLEDTGSYECDAINAIGRNSASTSIIIAELPQIQLIPDITDLEVTEGEELSITCKAVGSPLPNVEWDHYGRDSSRGAYDIAQYAPSHPSAVMFISRVTKADAKLYTCTASNNLGSVHKYVNVRVKAGRGDTDIYDTGLPTTPRSRNFFAELGDDAKISCDVENDDRRQMRTDWERLDGRPLPPYSRIEGNNLIINHVNHDSVGVYRCNIIDMNNGIPLAYFDANLILLNLPHITLSPEMPMTVSQGQTVDIFCNVTGEHPIDIEWHAENNRQLPPTVRADGPYLRFHAIRFGDAGRYFCTASNRYGNATKVAEVVVNHSTTTHERPQVSRTQEIDEGGDVVLECDVDNNYIRPGTRYVWRRNGSTISPYAVQEHNRLILRRVRIDDEGDYTCEIVSPSGIVAKSSVQLIIKPVHPVNRPTDVPEKLPILKLDQENSNLRIGESTEVECYTSDSTYPDVIWEREDGRPLPYNVRQIGNKLIITQADTTNAGRYVCKCRTDQGDLFTTSYDLAIEEDTKRQLKQPKIEHAEVGSNVKLNCDPERGQGNYRWSRQYGQMQPGKDIQSSDLRLEDVQARDAGTYICTVNNNGETIDVPTILVVTGAIPHFHQAPLSYMAFPVLESPYMKFNFEVTFRPEQPDGLILYNGQKKAGGDYIALSLNDRYPEFRFDFGNKPTIIRAEKPVSLGKWHTIKVSRIRRDGYVIIDDQTPIAFPPAVTAGLDLVDDLLIGGSPRWEDLVSSSVEKKTGFVGCISRLVLQDKTIELIKDAKYKEGITSCEPCAEDPCENDGICLESQTETGYSCICQDGYTGKNCAIEGTSCTPGICGSGRCENTDMGMECFCPMNKTGDRCQYIEHLDESILSFRDGSYAAYKTPRPSKLNIKFRVKPHNLNDSVILYVAESEHVNGDFVAVLIKDKHIELRINTGARVKPVIVTSLNPIEINKWTDVEIGRRVGEGYLKVGNEPEQTGKASGPARSLYLKTHLYVGGYDKRILLNRDVGISRGFDGCIAHLEESTRKINLIAEILDAANIQNCGDNNEIVPLSTGSGNLENHVASGCSHDPCENDGECVLVNGNDSYECHCPLGYSGKHCEEHVQLEMNANFKGNGYLELNQHVFSEDVNQFESFVAILFSTTSPNGLLIWWGQGKGEDYNGQDFIALAIVDGILEYSFRLDGEENSVQGTFTRVDDGLRHVAIIRRRGNEVSLELDHLIEHGETKRPTARSTMQLPGHVFIGGAPNLATFTGNRYTHPFNGCVRVVEAQEGGPINLGQHAISGINVDTCPREDEEEDDLEGTEPPVV